MQSTRSTDSAWIGLRGSTRHEHESIDSIDRIDRFRGLWDRPTHFWFEAAFLDFQLPVWSHSIRIAASSVRWMEPKNISIALLSSLDLEIYTFTVWRPPPRLFHIRFSRKVSTLVPLDWCIAITILLILSCLQAEILQGLSNWGLFNYEKRLQTVKLRILPVIECFL